MSWLANVGVFGRSFCILVVLCAARPSQAQTASPNSPLPRFPKAAKFDPKIHPASGAQHAAMVEISAGTYLIGSPAQHPLANRAAMPAHHITLRAFKIDRTEVTNAQFAEFMSALPGKPIGTALGGKVTPANIAPADHALFLEFSSRPSPYTMIDLDDEEARIGVRDGRFVANPDHENHPVTETTWAGALAYCQWRGARLPSEIEWEAAARGMEGRPFPWGDAMPTPELAVIGLPSGTTVPVGSRPKGATPDGLLDMAGSLLEWTASLDRPYPYRADDGREDLRLPGERIVRGGNYVFDDTPDKLVAWNRTVAGAIQRPVTAKSALGAQPMVDGKWQLASAFCQRD